MKNIFKILLIMIYTFIAGSALATTDNNYQGNSLINAVRNNYNNSGSVNFSVVKTEYFDSYAYFCGIPLYDNGDYFKNNEFTSVYDMLMQRSDEGSWKQIANFNHFASNNTKSVCHLSGGIEKLLSELNNSNDFCKSVGKGTPERKNILDAVRDTKNQQLIVTRLCKTSSIAYFCGVSLDEKTGFINRTDNAIDVNDVILMKNSDGKWNKIVDLGLFAIKVKDVKCYFGNEGVSLQNYVLQDAANKLKE